MNPRLQNLPDLVELLRIRAEERGDQTAFRFLEDGSTESARLTYAEVDRRARSLAGLLQGWGFAGERALLLFPPGLDFVTAFWGCLYAGVVAVPAYPPRARDRWGRLGALAGDARPAVVLCSPQVAERGPEQGRQVPELAAARWVAHDAAGEAERGAEGSWVSPAPGPDGLAFLQYTSGSTGAPRGVMVTHGNLLHNQEMIRRAFGQDERSVVVGWLPLYHDMGLIGNVLQPLYVGGSCILMPPLAFLQHPRRWLEAVGRYRATTSGGPNFAYDLCVRRIPPEQREGLDLSSWTLAFNGAEPVRAATLERFTEAFAPCGFDRAAFYPCYGLAEATLFVAGGVGGRLPTVEPEGGRVSCGQAWGGQRLAVVDPETGAGLPAGQVGEIWVAGPSVAAGYWNRPAETGAAFGAVLRDGCGPCLRTGDLGFVRDGELVVTGRLKDLIILRGRNLYPQDLELTAEQAHPALRAGCGAAFSVDAEGEERLILVCEVERHPGDLGLIADAVRRAVAEEHGVRVADVVLLRMGTIPKTSSGKIRRRECRDRHLAGELVALHRSTDRAGSAGRFLTRQDLLDLDPAERAGTLLAWLCEEVARRAGVAAEGVDAEAVLAAAGLDSLGLFDLQGRLEADLGFAPAAAALSGLSVAALRDQLLAHLADAPETGGTDLPPLVRGPVLGEHPLAPGQEALWFLERTQGAAGIEGVYHLAAAARLGAAVDGGALLGAVPALVARHPALRTRFAERGGVPYQEVLESLPPDVAEVDAAAWSAAELDGTLRREARRRLDLGDLAGGSPLRLRLFHRAGGERILLLVLHHLVGDFWSLVVLLRDWAALAAGQRLPEPPAAYTDFAAWQRRLLAGPAGGRLERHWHDRLRGAPLVLDLPTDRPRPPVSSHAGERTDLRLDPGLTARVRALGRASGATLFATLLAAFQLLLGRLAGQDDLLTGAPTTGRRDRDLDGVVGYFVNPVALRADLSGDPPFAEHLARTRRTVAEALEHRDLPFARLTRTLQPARDPGRPPVVQVFFALQRAAATSAGAQEPGLAAFALGQAGAHLEVDGLALESVRLDLGTSQLDLTLFAAETGDALVLSCEHDTALFDAVTIGRWLGHLETLLDGAAAHPETRLGELPLLTGAERHQALTEWNDSGAEETWEGPVSALVERRARERPDDPAVVDASSRTLTYRELTERAGRLAGFLQTLGVGPEAIVAVLAERSPEVLVGLLGILQTGAAYLPLAPSSPAERLAAMLAETAAAVVLTGGALRGRLPVTRARIVDLDRDREEIERHSPLPPVRVEPDHLAYVLYTSGSTGRPKGVQIPHRGLMNLVRWDLRAHGTGPGDRRPLVASLGFDASVWEIWACLASGAALHLPAEETRLDPRRLAAWMAERGITVAFLPTPLAEPLLAAGEPAIPSLRRLLVGGDRLRLHPDPACGFALVNHYGPTEASVVTSAGLVPPRPRGEAGAAPSLGRPVDGLRIHLLDRSLRPVPPGVAGELWVGGPSLARGYLGDPGRTAERFAPDPFGGGTGGRLYRTGDLVRRLADGSLDFLGRFDHQVKIRGVRIELGEIEAALTALEGVREAVVLAREDRADGGPGDRRLVAYVVGGGAPGALRRGLRERLPEHMVPAVFVTLAALPLTANGKVDRKALPAPEVQSAEEGWLAPRTPAEEVLAGIWAELLGLERVAADGHFFDLGGHSLLATRVMSRLRGAFGVEMPLRDLFEAPVLADLAARVEAARRSGAVPPAPPLVPLPRQGPLPLSFAQQRLWFIDQLEPGGSLYNIPVALGLEGPLDAAVLAGSLGEIVRRHEALRTVFAAPEGTPVQVIRPAVPFVLPVVDLSGLSDRTDRSDLMARQARLLAHEEALRPFDLARGPLLRALLVRRAAEDHLLALTVHHIAADGWSLGILVREATALYAALAEGRPSPLPDLPVQTADFAVWQHSWLHGEVLEGEISFWRRQFAGLPPLLELPTDRPRPAVQSYRGASRPVHLPAGLIRPAETLARREGATLFMVLLAAFQALLARHSGQQDLAVGTPAAGRNRVETEGLIGFFVNTLVLRGDLAGEPTFRELLGRVRETTLAAHLHQDVPLERLVQELAPERSLAHAPLFQVMLALQNAPLGSLEIKNLRLRRLDGAATTAKLDLTVSLEEHGGGLGGPVEYATDLFDATTVERLTGHFERLLGAALAAPERSVFALPLLSAAERGQILAEWNDTAPAFPREAACLHELFAAQVQRTPEAVALLDGTREIRYRELALAAGRLAARLRLGGAGPEVVAGVCLERSTEMVTALLAILQAGAAYLPLDPRLPRPRLESMLAGARAAMVISDEKLAARLPWNGPVVLVEQEGAEDERADRGVRTDPANLAYVLFTSGSTGEPKGVAVTHRSAVALVRWAGSAYAPEELSGVLAATALSFDLSVFELFVPLSWGGTVILARNVLELPALLAAGPAAGRVTLVNTVPSAMSELVRAGGPGAGVRTVNLAGEPLPRELAERLYATGTVERVWNLYGPSEDTTYSTFARVPRDGAVAPSIGRPLPATQARVLAAGLDPVPVGVAGELYLGGAGLARGYLHRPDLTAERFLPDPFAEEPGARLYRTGDRVRWTAAGELDFLGRLDHQIKIRGFRIELGEIETALAGLAGVRAAAVVVHGDRGGPGDRRLVAYVAGDAAPDELRRSLQERLPDYMVPAVFVTLAALPMTPSGKVDRRALPAPGRRSTEEGFRAPRTPVEEVLAGIWAELLGLERVGVDDHFFHLGGHSLLATRVMSRLRSAFGVEMPLRDLFEAPVLAGLAARVEAARIKEGRRSGAAAAAPPLVPVPREGPLPLSFAQQRLWFIDQLEPGSPLYNMPAALRVGGPLDAGVLARTLGEIVRRHEALRTVFAAREGAPVQVIQPAVPFVLPRVDLSGLPESRREPQALVLAGEEAHRPFDLTRDPLLRGVVLRLSGADHVLALTMHHIASDGWSMGVLIREVTALYAAWAEGRPSPLPEPAVQYADFAVWQRSWLHGEVLESEISFWRRQLAGLPPLLALPTDRPRPAVQSFRGTSRPIGLPPELIRAAQALGRREGATLFMVLLAGFQALLARYSGQEDFAVGSPVAGRNRVEIEGLVGFFVNTLVLRGDLKGEPSFRELLGRVRETALDAYLHQEVPFEKLVEELAPEKSLAQTPLFQVMLVLQNAPVENLEIRNLSLRPVSGAGTTAKLDLTVSLEEQGGGLAGTVTYATDLFDAATIDRLTGHFERLLAAAVPAPETSVFALPLLNAAELHQLVQEGGDFPAPPPGPEPCVHELFAAQVARAPAALALVDEEGVWTYAELGLRVRWLARRLRAAGVEPDQPVLLCAERGARLVVGLLGILEAGGAYLAVEPDLPRARMELLAEDARVSVAVTERPLAFTLPSRLQQVLLDADDPDADDAPGRAEPAGCMPPAAVTPGHLAYVLYTSGSTGAPKGVMVEHRQLTAYVRGALERLAPPPAASFATVSSFAADLGNTSIFAALLGGGCLHVPDRERLADAAAFAGLMERQPVDVLKIVPSHLAALLTAERPERSLPRRLLVLGGEPLPWSLVDRVRALAPQCRIFNHYGPTETAVGVLAGAVGEADAVRGTASVPLGRPLGLTRGRVVDRHLRLVPAGVPGELCIGGPQVARGYLGRPDLTAERFIPDPFGGAAGERLYRTGDLVRRRPGHPVEFLGRTDHQVKVRGFRIELGEVEAALRALPGVREAVVVAREDRSEGGAGDRRLVAYVVGDDAAGSGAEGALRLSLRERLPDYMVPVAFVTLAELPLTPNGKVDRARLPSPRQESAAGRGRPPQDPVEQLLAGIWAETLGVGQVSADDNFFTLGGHSLLATRLVSRLRRSFSVDLPLRALFETPVLSSLAARITAERSPGGGAPPLRRRAGAEAPLSFAQERLWFLDQLAPGRPTYNLQYFSRAAGPLHLPALAAALHETVRRHEVLRTTFRSVRGRPAREVHEVPAGPAPPVPAVDLSALRGSRAAREAERLMAAEARRPFDLVRGPLLRCTVVRLAAEEHLLLLGLHHIVSDAWSRGVLASEVQALYAAAVAGSPSPLRELPVQYADYAAWQRGWLDGATLDRLIAFWLRQLGGGTTGPLELPADRPRPAHRSGRGGVRTFRLPAPLAGALSALARREGATLFMVLLAAFDALLSRICRQEDVRVGFPIAHRNREEIEGLIGFFSNTLILPAHLPAGLCFFDLIRQVRETTLGAFDHQDLPFEKLVEAMGGEQSRDPLQAVFVLQNAPMPDPGLAGLRLTPLDVYNGTAKFDLVLALAECGGHLDGSLQFDGDLFDSATAARLVEHLVTLLSDAAGNPARPICDLSLLTAGARQRLLIEGNDTRGPGEPPVVTELFAGVAARCPGEVAVVWGGDGPGTDRELGYGELDRSSSRLAWWLRRRGVGPGRRVGICLGHSPSMVVAVLGVLKSGAAYVPLDPRHPRGRLAFLAGDAGIALWLTDREGAGQVPAGIAPVLDLESGWEEVEQQPETPLPPPLPESPAYVIYTSGSTGRPKGVILSHRALSSYTSWAVSVYLTEPGLTLPLYSSLAFDLTVTSLFPPLVAGQRIRIYRGSAVRVIEDIFREGRVDVVKLTPSHLALVRGLPCQGSRIRRLIVGGEALDWSLAAELVQAFGGRLEIFNEYGPTEAAVGCMIHRFAPGDPRLATVPIGRPAGGDTIYVLDAGLSPVPENVTGEIYIGGEGLAQCYLGQPALTAERFLPHPFAPGERVYRSGDLARVRAGGTLEFLGRRDSQVKLHGHRLELDEIRAALVEHSQVRDAVVRILDDGRGGQVLAAYYLARREQDAAALRAFLAERLAEEVLPGFFVYLRRLPLTLNGKVNLEALPGLAEIRERITGAGAVGGEAPRSPTVDLLAVVWSDVLRVPRIREKDNFFALGGHSLLGAQVIARVRETFGVDLALRALFERPTVAELAELIDAEMRAGRSGQEPPLAAAPRDGNLPLSFAQNRFWFMEQLQPDRATYNLAGALRLAGRLDVGALAASLIWLVCRHESLRSSFPTVAGRPALVVARELPLVLPVVDLTALAGPERRGEERRLTRAEVRRPFDVARGPLLRAALLRLEPREHVLLIGSHHLVCDGASLDRVFQDLTLGYRAFAERKAVPLQPLRCQYADFAIWQRRWLTPEVIESQLAYWRRQLARRPARLVLPTDLHRPGIPSGRGATHTFTVPGDLLARLRDLGRRHGVTLFMTLLAAYQLLLHRYSGEDRIPVGSPIATRHPPETAEMVGLLLNTTVLCTDLGGNPTFAELLHRVREVTLGAHAHQDLPFEVLVEALAPGRSGGASPLFQVWFVCQRDFFKSIDLPGLAVTPVAVGSGLSQFDLILSVLERDEELEVTFTYAEELFRSAVIDEMSQHLIALLEAVAADERCRLLQIPLTRERDEAAAPAIPPPLSHGETEDHFAF